MTDDYKNYSLEKLSEFLQDALQTEATPTEIYSTIITTLKKEVDYHEVCRRQAQDILDLMKDNDHINFKVEDYEIEHPYGESCISASNDIIRPELKNNFDVDLIKFPNRY